MNRSNLEPLSAQRHGHLYWRRARGYRHAAERTRVPITAQELPRAVGAFPIAIAYHGQRPVLEAMLGLEPRRSAFVDTRGRWRGSYVPAYLRTHPFYLAETDAGERHVVAVDGQAGELSEDPHEGDALFTAEGAASEALEPVLEFLRTLARNRVATDRACAALEAADVLVPWSDRARDGGRRRYRVDERRLAELEPEALARLRDTGALSVAYGQVLSSGQGRALARRAQARAREQESLPGAEAVFEQADLDAQIDWDALDEMDPIGDEGTQGEGTDSV